MNKSADIMPAALPRKKAAFRRRLLPLLLAACFGGGALANPAGPQVINGQAGFSSQGNILSIANTPGAIIHWQNFSINAGEITRFVQQSADSSVLNRVVGQDPSRILGALQSNGRVFLINPNGILFGAGAQVDVNGLVASTLNLSNEDFLSGKLNFHAGAVAGSVRNEGTITTPSGGQVVLIAPNVENSGIITSPRGEITLAAGHSVQLADTASPDLHVVVSAPDDQAINLGQIITQGGKAGIYGALVRQRGIVSADSAVVGEDGRVVFKASRDAVLEAGSRTSATGAGRGGTVQVLGDAVSLLGDAAIDVSGQRGGGTALIGGDYQGGNPAVPHATSTTMSADASVRADALGQGDGGRIVLWSDGQTTVHGTLSANGGALGGQGGLIETSGHQLAVDGVRVSTAAAMGKAGTWLLDPDDIYVVTDDDSSAVPVGTSIIRQSVLENASSNVSMNALRNIEIRTPVSLSKADIGIQADASGSLSVLAGSSITTHGGAVRLTARDGGAIGAGIATHGGAVSIVARSLDLVGVVGSDGGAVTLQASDGDVTIRGNLSTGNADLQITGKNVTLSSQIDAGVGIVSLTATGQDGGAVNLLGNAGILTRAQSDDGLTGRVNLVAANAGGAVNMASGTYIKAGGDGLVYLRADNMKLAGSIVAGGSSESDIGNVMLHAYSAGRNIELGQKPAVDNGSLALDAADLGTISADQLSIGNPNGGNLGVTADTALGGAIRRLYLSPGGDIHIDRSLVMNANNSVLTAVTGEGGSLGFGAEGALVTSGTAGMVQLVADRIDLNSGGIAAGSARIESGNVGIRPVSDTRGIDIVGAFGPAVLGQNLELKADDLKTIRAGNLVIGGKTDNLFTGDIAFKTGVDVSGNVGTLLLQTGCHEGGCGTITQLAGAGIKAGGLVIGSRASVDLSSTENSIDRLAAEIGGARQSFRFRNNKDLIVDSLAGVEGINVDADASYTSETRYSPGSTDGVISLIANGGITQSDSGLLKGLAVNAEGTYVSLGSANTAAAVAGKVHAGDAGSGFFHYNSVKPLTVSRVDGNNGIVTAGQDVSVTASGDVSIGRIDAGTGNIHVQGDSIVLGTADQPYASIAGAIISLVAQDRESGVISTRQNANASPGAASISGQRVGLIASSLDFTQTPVTIVASDSFSYASNQDYGTLHSSALDGATIQTPRLMLGFDLSGSGGTTGNINIDSALRNAGGSIYLYAQENVTQSETGAGGIVADKLGLYAGGSIALNHPDNQVAVLGAIGADVSFTNKGNLQVGIDNFGAEPPALKSLKPVFGDQVTYKIPDATAATAMSPLPLNTATTYSPSSATSSARSGDDWYDYLRWGVYAYGGNVRLTATHGGNLTVPSTVTANPGEGGGGQIALNAAGSIATAGDRPIAGDALSLASGRGVSIRSSVSSLSAINHDISGGSDISVTNIGVLLLGELRQEGTGNHGNITIENYGGLTTGGIDHTAAIRTQGRLVSPGKTEGGNIHLAAHSPLTVNGPISSAYGNIYLEAGATAGSGDLLTILQPVTTGGAVTLLAADGLSGADQVSAASISINGSTSTPTPTPTPAPIPAPISTPTPISTPAPTPTADTCASGAGCDPAVDSTVRTTAAANLTVVLGTSTQATTPATGEEADNGGGSPREKNVITGPRDSGVKKHETEQKLYCN